jgi:hypothetical protein
MLYFGFFLDEYNRQTPEGVLNLAKESMILVDRDERDLRKGVVLYREGQLQRSLMGYPELFFVNPKNRSTCLTGFVNRIVTFDDKEVTDVYRFKLGTGSISEEAQEMLDLEEVKLDDLTDVLRTISQATDGPMVRNTYNIMVDGNTVSFRCTYSGAMGATSSSYLYFVHNDKGTKVYKHLRIPGLAKDVDPTGCNGNHQIAIIENLGDDAIDKNAKMSPLAQQIIDELKKQNDDNPVLIEFRFK